MLTIWYDMDNTIAQFSIKGKESIALEMMHSKGYFYNLPVLDGANFALRTLDLVGFDVRILSALIDSPYVENEKYLWIKEHFPFIEKNKILFVPLGTNKAKAVGNVEGQVLVDDFSRNLKEWEADGGIPIKKRYSNKNGYKYVIRHHREIFPILAELQPCI